jgi:hypothetical protein
MKNYLALMNNDLERMLKVVDVPYFKALPQRLFGGIEENHEEL